MTVDEIAEQVDGFHRRHEQLTWQAGEFCRQVRKNMTGQAPDIAAAMAHAISDQQISDCWIAIASVVTNMMRDIPPDDRTSVILGLNMMIDQMLDLPEPEEFDG